VSFSNFEQEHDAINPARSEDSNVIYKRFQGSILGSKWVIIRWETLSEKNNDRFVLERSADAQSFDSIASLGGAIKSEVLLRYNFIDFHPLLGNSYYRLRNVSVDGKESFSDTLTMLYMPEKQEIRLMEVDPVPFKSQFTISYISPQAGSLHFLFYDIKGKLLFKQKIEARSGSNEFTFTDTLNLVADTYIGVLESWDKKSKLIELIKE